jgi:hypothetical protein
MFKLKFKPSKRKSILRLKPVKLKFFNTSKFPKRSKAEWKLIDKNPFGDTDKDRVPNWFDCKPLNRKKQGWVGKGKYKVYSLRPYSETYTGNIHPADDTEQMSYGRNTGYFGTGIYGFNTKQLAMKHIEKDIPTRDNYGSQGRRHIREFVVDNPLVLKNKHKSEALFEASKMMNDARHGDKEKMWRAKYRLQEAGINATDEEIKQSVEEKSKTWRDKTGNRDQPITRLLKRKGYGGVITSKEYQTFHDGSVVHVGEEIPKDTTPLSKREILYKKISQKIAHQVRKENWKRNGREDLFEDKEIPQMITGEWRNGKSIDYKVPKYQDDEDAHMEMVMKKYDKPKEVIESLKQEDTNDNQIPDSAEEVDIEPIEINEKEENED